MHKDMKNCHLIGAVTLCSYTCTCSDVDKPSNLLSTADDFLRLLGQSPALTQPTFLSASANHGVERHSETTVPPVFTRAWRLDPAKSAIARVKFASMERLCIVAMAPTALGLRPSIWSPNLLVDGVQTAITAS